MNSVILASSILSVANQQPSSICSTDDRVESETPFVGTARPNQNNGVSPFCTLTLISDSCALTAGHCLSALGEAEFFPSKSSLLAELPKAERVFAIDQQSIAALQSRIGNDWAVVRLRPNSVSGLLPGKVFGFIEPELEVANGPEQNLQVTAVEYNSNAGSFRRMESKGQTLWTDGSILFHDLDTDKGSSGALIINPSSQKAVAIHTHGGCDTMKNNKATIIARVPFLVRAIRACTRAAR